MVKVNLLSLETNKTKDAGPPITNIQWLPRALLSLIIIFFSIAVYLRLVTVYQKKGLREAIKQYEEAEALAKKVKTLKEELDKLNGELNLFADYLKREIAWSEKLSELRNLVPQEIWLTQLSFEKKEAGTVSLSSLFLKGSLIPQEKTSPIGTLSKFINQLKEAQEFSGDFQNLILSDSRTETKHNVEIMTFTIEMPFRKDKI